MSFREFITNRLFRLNLSRSVDDPLAHIRAPRNPSPEYIGKLVNKLLDPEAKVAAAAERELELIGSKAREELTKALLRPEFLEHKRLLENWSQRLPIHYLLGVVSKIAPEAMLAAAPQMILTASEESKKAIGGIVASTGRDEAIPVIATLLQDPDGYVRSSTVFGIRSAMNDKTGTRNYCQKVYELLLDQCDQKCKGTSNEAVGILFKVDAQRAARDLVTSRWLSSANPIVHEVLEALNENQVMAPVELLQGLLETALPLAEPEKCYPQEYIVARAVNALAAHPHVDLEPILQHAERLNHDIIQEALGEALARRNGLHDVWKRLVQRFYQQGMEKLTLPQRVYFCATEFDAEVCNGGLMQFFGNTSGDHAVETLEALQILKHPEAVKALEESMALIGPAAKLSDRDERLDGFSDRYDELQAAFEPLEKQYYKQAAQLRRKIQEYAARHAEQFR